jgi:hypothetical protein
MVSESWLSIRLMTPSIIGMIASSYASPSPGKTTLPALLPLLQPQPTSLRVS